MSRSDEVGKQIVRYVHTGDVLVPAGSLAIEITVNTESLRRADAALARLRQMMLGQVRRVTPFDRPPLTIIDQE